MNKVIFKYYMVWLQPSVGICRRGLFFVGRIL